MSDEGRFELPTITHYSALITHHFLCDCFTELTTLIFKGPLS